MKKTITVLLSIILLLGVLCACTPSADSDHNSTEKYAPGESTAAGWKSSWMGLQYTPGSSMVMATSEEIENMMELGADVMQEINGELTVDWDKVNVVYEMMATNPSNGSNVIICAEKPSLSNMTETQYLDTLTTQLNSVYSNVVVSDPTIHVLGGISFRKVNITATLQGMSINQTYLVAKKDGRMVGIIFTCTTANALSSMLEGFSGYSG